MSKIVQTEFIDRTPTSEEVLDLLRSLPDVWGVLALVEIRYMRKRMQVVPGGCDCSRCQTEGCVANTYCPCCLRSERDILRKTINETEIALHKPWECDCECCLRIGEELGAWGGTPAWETRALNGDNDD